MSVFGNSSGITTKLSLQNLPPDDCLRFVMKQETECGAALLAADAPHSVNKIWQRHLTCEYRSKYEFVVPALLKQQNTMDTIALTCTEHSRNPLLGAHKYCIAGRACGEYYHRN